MRRALTLLILLVALLAVSFGSPGSTKSGFLLVADTAAEKLYVFSLPDMVLTGQVENVRLGVHTGTLALPDGQILLVDDRNVEFLALRIDAAGQPMIAGRAKMPAATPWNRAAWGAVDRGMRYFAVRYDTAGGEADGFPVPAPPHPNSPCPAASDVKRMMGDKWDRWCGTTLA